MNDVDVLLNKAFACYNQGNYLTAENYARSALSLSKQEPDALYLLGLLAFLQKVYGQSELYLTQAHLLCPDNATYTLALAFTLQTKGDLSGALTLYQAYPQNANALAQIGMIEQAQGKTSFAKNAFQKALKLCPTCDRALLGLALLQYQAGHPEKAIAFLKKARPKTAEIYYQLGQWYFEQGQDNLSHTALQKALALAPLPKAWYYLGQIAEHKSDKKKAHLAYQNALQQEKNALFYGAQGALYLAENNLKTAQGCFENALQQNDKDINALHNLGVLYDRQGDKAAALEKFRAVLQINPRHVPTLYNLAQCVEETAQYTEALGLYFNIKILSPAFENLSLHIARCITALYQTDKSLAKTFIKGWNKHFPTDVVGQYMADMILHHQVSSQTTAYIQMLYQAFAHSYDDKMKTLKTGSIPVMKQALQGKYKKALDLGCGTGQIGQALRGHIQKITGVDISPEMLALARQKKVYDILKNQTIEAFLATCKTSFDLITMADVFCYIGNPAPLICSIADHLTSNGIFAFTTESSTEKKIIPTITGRWQYPDKVIEKIIKTTKLVITQKQNFPLRHEGKQMLTGTLFIVKKTL